MTWVEARLVPFALPLARPLVTAHGRRVERRGWLLRLRDAAGVEGHATAMPIEGFGGEADVACGAALAAALDLARDEPGSPGPPLSGAARAPFAASAWRLAHADLSARQSGRPLAHGLSDASRAPRASVAVNALLTAADADALRAQIGEARDFEVLKLKVGRDVDAALSRIEVARSALRAGQRLRIDPNASWSEDDAARALGALEGAPVDYVEQPVEGAAALGRLRARSRVRVAADESVSDADALAEVVRAHAADVAVLKPMRIGGPALAVRLGALAQAAGLEVTVTSLLDSAIGVRAALAVALALPEAPLSCGLATASIFDLDLAAPPPGEPGRLCAWSEPGLGTTIDEDALRDCAQGPVRTWERA